MTADEKNGQPGTPGDPRKVDSHVSRPTRSALVISVWTVVWLALCALGAITLLVLQAASPCVDEVPLVDSAAEQAAWPLLLATSVCFGAAAIVGSRSFLIGLLTSVGSFVLILFVAFYIGYAYCS